jgi:hypothetical protein
MSAALTVDRKPMRPFSITHFNDFASPITISQNL